MSYFAIWKDKSFTRIFMGTTIGRFAQYMFDASLVIFISQNLHNPTLAGLSVFFATVPGLILSPVSGSFLAGKNPSFWMGIDFLIKAMICGLLANYGPSAGNIAICMLSFFFSISSAFGTIALRGYIAFQVPTSQKGIANSLDATSTGLATIIGPALAGLCCTIWGGKITVYVVGGVYLCAVAISLFIRLSSSEKSITYSANSEMNMQIALQSIFFIIKHPLLRTMTLVYFLYQMTIGMITILLPEILTLQHLIFGWIGICWAITGITGIIASFFAGYLTQHNRDKILITAGTGIALIGILILLGGISLRYNIAPEFLLLSFALLGLSEGAIDVGILGLRQIFLPAQGATTILAVSYSLNMAGFPVGTFLIGLISHISLSTQFIVTTSIIFLSVLLSLRLFILLSSWTYPE